MINSVPAANNLLAQLLHFQQINGVLTNKNRRRGEDSARFDATAPTGETLPASAAKIALKNHSPMKLKTIISILLILIFFSCNEKNGTKVLLNNYKEYVPQFFNGDGLIEAPSMMTKEHKENVIHVLKYYGADWKLENDKLFVSRKIDNEILWNYTSKANDSIWLENHKLDQSASR